MFKPGCILRFPWGIVRITKNPLCTLPDEVTRRHIREAIQQVNRHTVTDTELDLIIATSQLLPLSEDPPTLEVTKPEETSDDETISLDQSDDDWSYHSECGLSYKESLRLYRQKRNQQYEDLKAVAGEMHESGLDATHLLKLCQPNEARMAMRAIEAITGLCQADILDRVYRVSTQQDTAQTK